MSLGGGSTQVVQPSAFTGGSINSEYFTRAQIGRDGLQYKDSRFLSADGSISSEVVNTSGGFASLDKALYSFDSRYNESLRQKQEVKKSADIAELTAQAISLEKENKATKARVSSPSPYQYSLLGEQTLGAA